MPSHTPPHRALTSSAAVVGVFWPEVEVAFGAVVLADTVVGVAIGCVVLVDATVGVAVGFVVLVDTTVGVAVGCVVLVDTTVGVAVGCVVLDFDTVSVSPLQAVTKITRPTSEASRFILIFPVVPNPQWDS